jgi:hypothetical protein
VSVQRVSEGSNARNLSVSQWQTAICESVDDKSISIIWSLLRNALVKTSHGIFRHSFRDL